MNKHASKLQSTGILAGLFALLCLPCVLAPLLISVGFSSVLVFLWSWFTPILLILILLSVVGFYLSFKSHHDAVPLIEAVLAAGLLFYGRIITDNQLFSYAGTFFILAAVATDWYSRRQHKKSCQTCGTGSNTGVNHAPNTCDIDCTTRKTKPNKMNKNEKER